MRLSLLLTAALLGAASLTPARAADGAPVKAARLKTTAPRKAATPHRAPAAPATARLQPAAVAPAKDVLNAHFAVTVVGTITNADGLPLAGATIWKTNTREVLAVANSQGDFTVTLPTNAPVTLTCGYQGYQEQQLDLRQPRPLNQFVVNLEREAAPKRH
ncbi:hypothetical protein EJV47_21470 [Hymenobacter gummosus]|uniref:Carboxypeptidase-like regulatory domain-containing protein n=1 Tax=Hymenobacter gummosus TaxID=1776032 RepID=A0A431TXH1_9BACT|nr:carboxypeptidase regulatory-like domain-containing protein [Hymenobacter gummosus]RTQ46525.1 hypothetical protein EJV47_21470 [Hymenobacter gummosus]